MSTDASPTAFKPGSPYTFINVIPKLGPHKVNDPHPSLLPLWGGQSGLIYLQCPVTYKKAAQDDPEYHWEPIRDTRTYTIRGPHGEVDCELLCSGTMLRGSDHMSNVRECFIHKDIWEDTGLDKETGFPPVTEKRMATEPVPAKK